MPSGSALFEPKTKNRKVAAGKEDRGQRKAERGKQTYEYYKGNGTDDEERRRW